MVGRGGHAVRLWCVVWWEGKGKESASKRSCRRRRKRDDVTKEKSDGQGLVSSLRLARIERASNPPIAKCCSEEVDSREAFRQDARKQRRGRKSSQVNGYKGGVLQAQDQKKIAMIASPVWSVSDGPCCVHSLSRSSTGTLLSLSVQESSQERLR